MRSRSVPFPRGLAEVAFGGRAARLIGVVRVELADRSGRVADGNRVGRDVLIHDRPASDDTPPTKRHAGEDHGVEPDPDVVLQGDWRWLARYRRQPARVVSGRLEGGPACPDRHVRRAPRVGDDDPPGQQAIGPNGHAIVTDDGRCVQAGKRAHRGPARRADHEVGPVVHAAGVAQDEPGLGEGVKRGERVGRVQVDVPSGYDVAGDPTEIPVPVQISPRGDHAASTTRAGLPVTAAPRGTSRLTIAPGSITAPAPTRTPLRIVALNPIQTSSSITTGRDSTAGRRRRSPTGDRAIASPSRAAGSSGWKSESAIVTPPDTMTRDPIVIREAHTRTAFAR